jgi:threonyl-tRNA synthetase
LGTLSTVVSDGQNGDWPVIEGWFYYDIAYERPFTPSDMAIESRGRRG